MVTTLGPRLALQLLRNSLGGGKTPARSHILLCIADHYEPNNGNVGRAAGLRRVKRWVEEYPCRLGAFRDSTGRRPQHTFFYPLEEYVPEYLDALGSLCSAGFGEVEVHLHHDHDSSENTRRQLLEFKHLLRSRHGMLPSDERGQIAYGFIHGNYALDNCRPDGRACGVNDELTILVETGCYADFTMPSAPDVTQTGTINSIYFAVDDPLRPNSHDSGVPARAGMKRPEASLLMIQGPLAFNWVRRKWGLVPRIENSELLHNNPPTGARAAIALSCHVHVAGRPEWIFVKLHTHGAIEPNADVLLGEETQRFHSDIGELAAARAMRLHYVTAREMANIASAAIDGHAGDPNDFRDYRYRLVN